MLIKLIKRAVTLRNYFIYLKYNLLARLRNKNMPVNSNANFVVSMASYPARSYLLPAVFESIARQTVKPKHILLVLTEEEWPNKDLPKRLEKLNKKGLQIIWTAGNPYSVKMLIPVIERYPDLGVITLGDDWIYKNRFIETTIKARNNNPGCITGPIGKVMYRKGEELNMYFRKQGKADPSTNNDRIYLMGLGTYYPPNSLSVKMLDLNAVKRIIPGRGSDLWFWAAAIAKGTKQICFRSSTERLGAIPIPENDKTKPKDSPGCDEMNKRFNLAIDYFEIRNKLLKMLPDDRVN